MSHATLGTQLYFTHYSLCIQNPNLTGHPVFYLATLKTTWMNVAMKYTKHSRRPRLWDLTGQGIYMRKGGRWPRSIYLQELIYLGGEKTHTEEVEGGGKKSRTYHLQSVTYWIPRSSIRDSCWAVLWRQTVGQAEWEILKIIGQRSHTAFGIQLMSNTE